MTQAGPATAEPELGQDQTPARNAARRRRAAVIAVLVLALVLAVGATVRQRSSGQPGGSVPDHTSAPVAASGSWWTSPLPADAPSNPDAAAILDYLTDAPQSEGGYLHLSGAGASPWGQPIYWSTPKDPVYDVRAARFRLPPELSSLRIPEGARPATTSDAAMVVVDMQRGYAVGLWRAQYDDAANTWSAGGAQVTYLASDGLDRRTGRSAEQNNFGSLRGNNPAVAAVRLDEVRRGSIPHVLKIAVGPESSTRYVFPMVGSDGDATEPAAPPAGLRLRIKPSVDLRSLGLDREALVIARAIQRYGVYIGDNSGVTSLKLENTRVAGNGQGWKVSSSALQDLPFTPEIWDVLPEGYDPSTATKGLS